MSTIDPLLVVGVDVGASKIASGLVELPSGRVLTSTSTPTPPLAEAPDHVDHVLRSARRMFEAAGKDPVVGLGVGVCELVDRQGRVRSAASVELRGERLAAELASLTRNLRIESDVRAHARAEAAFGHGRAFEDLAFVSVGTGVSSCLVIGGRPYPGARGNAIVLASSPLTVRCTSCGASTSETLEEVASGRALAEGWGSNGAKDVFEAAAAGDERANALIARAALALGGSLAFLRERGRPRCPRHRWRARVCPGILLERRGAGDEAPDMERGHPLAPVPALHTRTGGRDRRGGLRGGGQRRQLVAYGSPHRARPQPRRTQRRRTRGLPRNGRPRPARGSGPCPAARRDRRIRSRRRPCSSIASAICAARAASPIMTGTIGCSPGRMLKPASVIAPRKNRVLPLEPVAQLGGSTRGARAP